MKYRKLPIEVEAKQVPAFEEGMGESVYRNAMEELAKWCLGQLQWSRVRPIAITINTKEGQMRADVGDWIIEEPNPTADRKFYPCKDDIFRTSYEPAYTSFTPAEAEAFEKEVDKGTDQLVSEMGLEKE